MLRSALVSEPRLPDAVPAELAAICRTAMSLVPGDRYDTADAFRAAIARFLSHRASEELSRAAEASLRELCEAVADARGDAAERRRVVQRAFAECHFGFREAARSWPESARAKAGMEGAILTMVGFELDRGDPATAAAHLAELASPPAELAARVRDALRAADEERRGIDELRKLGRDHDPRIGRGARIAAMAILGAAFTFSPAINWLRGVTPSYRGLFSFVTAFLVLSGVVVYVGRRELLATALNRRLVGSLFVTLGTQVLLHTSAYLFGLPPEASQLMQFCIWMVISGMLAVFVDARLWPAVATFAVGWIATALHYELRPLLSTIGNGVLAANLIWVWKRSERR
jgi:serine/threonine-protein kinase